MLHGTLTSKAAGHKRFSSWMEKHPLPQDTQPNSKPGAKAAGLTDIRYTLLSEAGYSLLQAKGLIRWINSYIPVIKRSNFSQPWQAGNIHILSLQRCDLRQSCSSESSSQSLSPSQTQDRRIHFPLSQWKSKGEQVGSTETAKKDLIELQSASFLKVEVPSLLREEGYTF